MTLSNTRIAATGSGMEDDEDDRLLLGDDASLLFLSCVVDCGVALSAADDASDDEAACTALEDFERWVHRSAMTGCCCCCS